MSLHKLSADNEGKNAVVSTDPDSTAVTVAADEIALWVGDLSGASNIGNLEVQVHNFVNDCLERFREIGTPTPSESGYNFAGADWLTEVPDKRDVFIDLNTAFITPKPTDVTIYYGDLFQPHIGSSISTAVKRLLEARQQLFGRKAAA